MPCAAELEEFRLAGQLIAVEDDMRLAARARLPREQRMLAAVAELAEVGKRTVR